MHIPGKQHNLTPDMSPIMTGHSGNLNISSHTLGISPGTSRLDISEDLVSHSFTEDKE